MHVVITGGAGFLGQQLARAILDAGYVRRDGEREAVDKVMLLDVVAANTFGDRRVESVTADIADQGVLDRLVGLANRGCLSPSGCRLRSGRGRLRSRDAGQLRCHATDTGANSPYRRACSLRHDKLGRGFRRRSAGGGS